MRAHLGTRASEGADGRTDLQRRWSQGLHGFRYSRHGGQTFGAMHQFMIAMRAGHRFGFAPKRFGGIEVPDRLERLGDVQATHHARIRQGTVAHGASNGIRHSPNGVQVSLPCGGQRRATKRGQADPVRDPALERCSKARRRDIRMTGVEE